MYVTNKTDDYDNITSSNYTDMLNEYDNITSTNMSTSNCTNKENIIDIIIPSLLLTIPSGLSLLYMLSLMVCTLIKPFFNNKWIRRIIYIQIIQFAVS